MNRLQNSTVRAGLVLGFGAVIVLLVVVSVTAYIGIAGIQRSQETLYEQNFGNAYDLAQLRANLNAERLAVAVMLDTKRVEWGPWQKERAERFEADEAIMQRLSARFRADPGASRQLNELNAVRAAFRETDESQLVPMLVQGRDDEARKLFAGIQSDRHAKMRSLARGLEQVEAAEARRVVRQADRKARAYSSAFIALSVAATLIALAFATFLNRGLKAYMADRKELETRLKSASAYARSLIEASLDPLVTISPAGKITDVNKATEEATGVPRAALIGSDFADYFTEPDKARQGYRQVLAEGLVRDYPLSMRHASGRVTDVLYNAAVYRSETGEVQGVFAAARDVTERKRLEAELKSASAYARSLIEASLDPLVTISPDGKITDVNKATEDATGVSRDQLIGSDFAGYFTEPDKARLGYQQVLAQGFVRDYPLALRHGSGKVTEVIYNASVFWNEAGEVQGVFAAARDITERKELERRVQERSARLERVLQEAQEAVNVLTSSTSEILTAISQLAAGATEAATAVSETTTTVEEVRQTAQLSNQKAKDIAEAGQNAARVLQAGQKNVEAAVAEMNRIRDQMGSIAETIVTLSEQSQAIGEITGTVNELAEQSNLLAVNAAIEAAKAGEQGKGFAVVAQEIRSLAEQSKQATAQVRSLLADIQKAIGNAVMATEQTGKVVESGVVQSTEAGESIRAAVEATVNVAHASTQIAASGQQQLIGVDQVATAMESINQTSTQNALTTKQVEGVAQGLHELSQKLKVLVEQYKVAGS